MRSSRHSEYTYTMLMTMFILIGLLARPSSAIDQTHEPTAMERATALMRLAERWDNDTLNIALDALNDPSYLVREKAAFVIRRTKRYAAVVILMKLVMEKSEHPRVRSAAAYGIQELGFRDPNVLSNTIGLDEAQVAEIVRVIQRQVLERDAAVLKQAASNPSDKERALLDFADAGVPMGSIQE